MKARSLLITISVLSCIIFLAGLIFWIHLEELRNQHANFKPQQTKLFTIAPENDTTLDVPATTLPQFALSLAQQKFNNLWQAHASERLEAVSANIVNARGNANVKVATGFNEQNKQLILTPTSANKVKPGLYRLSVKVKTVIGENITITQDFNWGVLAINTNKATYKVGEEVRIGMAVLDDYGTTKCIAHEKVSYGTAKVQLEIKTPTGKLQQFSTEANTIKGSKECADRSVTNKPDFEAAMPATEAGTYHLHMEAETFLGTKSIDDVFTVVKATPVFDIERTEFPIRIYPRADYPVEISIKANADYKGPVSDFVPDTFKIRDISQNGEAIVQTGYQTITWQVDWKKGETHALYYTIDFPPIAPEFYLVGPLTIGQYKESREWQIASDSIFSLVQEAHNTAASGLSVVATFSSGATAGHLIILICSRDTNNTWNTPSGYTRRFRVTTAPRIYFYDRIATAGLLTGTCTTSTNSGEIAAQLLEFSGNSTSGYFDKVATSTHNSGTCNTGGHTETTNNLTPTNPDELIVSAFASNTGSLTVTSHNAITGVSSSGFVDTETDGFSASSSSYDSGWGEAVNNPATVQHDVATFSGAAGTCSSDMAAYNAQITISQGSYRFFDNADSVLPGATLAAVNTAITLSQPNYKFRLRILLDVDSATGSLGIDAGDFILQYAERPVSNLCSDAASTDWFQVTNAVGANDPPIAFNPNPSVTEGSSIASSGNDPADTPTYTTVFENYYGDDNNAGTPPDIANHQTAIANNQAGLWDLSLVDNTDDSVSTTYCLRLADSSGAELAAYRNYPQVTTIPIDVTIRGGSTIRGGVTIR